MGMVQGMLREPFVLRQRHPSNKQQNRLHFFSCHTNDVIYQGRCALGTLIHDSFLCLPQRAVIFVPRVLFQDLGFHKLM